MAVSFDELAAWCSARNGQAGNFDQTTVGGEWRAGARWIAPNARIELRGRSNSVRDARIWSLDLGDGAIAAVEDAEVELTYRIIGTSMN